MLHTRQCLILVLTLLLTLSLSAGHAAACKVLVVYKNSSSFGMHQEMRRGIEKVLGERCDLKHIYFNYETEPELVEENVQNAYSIYQEWQPDGVIASEEDVNPLFVVPYLKETVETPVIFAGLMSPPDLYGYPATNVTGVVNRPFIEESLTFMRQLDPSIQRVSIACNDDQAAHSGSVYIQKLYEEMGMTFLEPMLSNDHDEMMAWIQEQKDGIDALFVCPLLGEKTVGEIVKTFPKPTFTCWRAGIIYGILGGVVESGEEIAQKASEMLWKAMNGTPISDLPIAAPEYGTRVINVNTMKALGIKPSRRVLTGVELIK